MCVLLFFFFAEADSVQSSQCTGSFETDCSSGTCTYTASWRVLGSRVQFNVSARVAGNAWVAIGFSNNMMMVSLEEGKPGGWVKMTKEKVTNKATN